MTELPTLGMRHIALNVRDVQKAKEFYCRVLKMQLEWEPDADNVYLTSGGQDNIAIHKAPEGASLTGFDRLDHIGFALPSPAAVDLWHDWISKQPDAKIVKEVKTHRDGARSFYFQDPNGIVTQMIYHAPIAIRAASLS